MHYRISLAVAFALASSVVRPAAAGAADIDYRHVAALHQGSLTSPILRRDATTKLRVGLAPIDHCPNVVVKSMSVTNYVSERSPWYERWVVADCKKTRVFTMKFTPTADGGADMEISGKR